MQHVLIADDHAITRRGIREILQDAFDGVQVVEVGDAQAVLEQLRHRRWDLILLDVMMPGPGILALLGGVRAQCAQVPVLVLTASNELQYVTETLKAGADGLLHKHHAADDLLQAVQQVVGGGTYLHPETAAAIARSLRSPAPDLPHAALSARELEVLCHIARGRAIKEIGFDLGLSSKTVATYLTRIREKTGLGSPVEIVRYALHHRLVD